VLAEERGAFSREQVVAGLERKMRRRHPQLYGDGPAASWEALKARERAGEAGSEEPAPRMRRAACSAPCCRAPTPSPTRSACRSASPPSASTGRPAGALEKVVEEAGEVGAELAAGNVRELEEELGDLLFSVVNLTRLCGVHAPTALTRANRKFTRRFEALEALAGSRGVDLPTAGLEKLDELWEEAKRGDR
jgi:uncharacterized protein YabN with tetrapyrrole methylase and pyrophosphatase domain